MLSKDELLILMKRFSSTVKAALHIDASQNFVWSRLTDQMWDPRKKKLVRFDSKDKR